MYFDINTSRARKTFKRLLGHANHYLITILIGLDYIKNNDVTLPEEFSTTWEPKNKVSSSLRSREFAIESTLSWAIDALDAYLGLCHKKPSLYQDKKLLEDAGAAGQSVFQKFMVQSNYINSKTVIQDYDKYCAIINLSIKWRNKLVHYFAENEISKDVREVLLKNNDFYSENFQGLDIVRFLQSFDNSQTPSFKEIASIIRGIHKYVEYSDEYFLKSIDKRSYFIDCLDFHFKLNTDDKMKLKQKMAQLYNNSEERRFNSLNQSIMNYGFSKVHEKTSIDENCILFLTSFSLDNAMKFLNETDYDLRKSMLFQKTPAANIS